MTAPEPGRESFFAWADRVTDAEEAERGTAPEPGRAAASAPGQAAEAAVQAAIASSGLAKSPEQVGTIAGTMAVYERDKAASELTSLRAHATSLAEDLDDAGATIGDYREALAVMQRARDAALSAIAAADAANGTLRADLASARALTAEILDALAADCGDGPSITVEQLYGWCDRAGRNYLEPAAASAPIEISPGAWMTVTEDGAASTEGAGA